VNDSKTVDPTVSGPGDRSKNLPNLPTTNCPRTLKDLIKMTKAAKEAQWGEHDEKSDASSTGFPALGSNYFEDYSDASSDSGDDQLHEVTEAAELKRQQKDSFGSYFDSHQRPVAMSSDASQGTSEQTSNGDDASAKVFSPSVGPASDMLTPLVKVSHEYDKIALNNQSPEFAMRYELGDLSIGPEYSSQLSDGSGSPLETKTKKGKDSRVGIHS